MKKIMILLAATSLLCGLALAGGNGAVKTDMVVYTDSGTDEVPAGTVIGSVNLNTTAAGTLIVVVNLDDAIPLEDDPDTEAVEDTVYDCRIWIKKIDNTYISVDAVDCLKVNANGEGTTNVKVDLAALPEGTIAVDATEIKVNVVVRPYFTPSLGTPGYVNGPQWRTDIVVPLK